MNPHDQPQGNQQVPQQPQYNQAGQNQPTPPPQGAQNPGQAAGPTQYVYVTRPHEPEQPQMSEEQRRRHEDAKRQFPDLNLSEGEFIISAVDRHIIGLLQIWALVGVVLVVIVGVVYFLAGAGGNVEGATEVLPIEILAIPGFLLAVLTLIFGGIATSIYQANRFFLTNESVIQQIQDGLFAKREQTVSLANIEDASYTQHGLLPHILNYGMIRLSTEGDETTYRFNYASRPRKTVNILNNAVEAFKNGRPVTTAAED